MISRGSILVNLKILDRKYRNATTLKESLFYSKLAVLELCGWIEESMDDVVLRCARRNLKNQVNFKYVRNDIVKRTSGFDYEYHFRRMLIQLLGIINVERIEKNVDQRKRLELTATLGVLKTVRDAEAHTHIKGVTRQINAPSVTLGQFTSLYDGLVEFEAILRHEKF